jgi:murein DD-endopeptidase MepM/ murein hydrolase activator NlpD
VYERSLEPVVALRRSLLEKGRKFVLRKRFIVYVTEGKNGEQERVWIPMRYAYIFAVAAVTGMFTIAGMAGSYGRMLVKAESVNSMRSELATTRKDYAHLEQKAHEKDVQAASLGSLATEVSAIYGLTAGKLSATMVHGHILGRRGTPSAAAEIAKTPLKDDSTNFNDESYYKSLETFYALKNTALEGINREPSMSPGFSLRSSLSSFASLDAPMGGNVPDMWPIIGPINSGFGEREDPILGSGEGEFHAGVDIGSPDGTPVHAPADGRVVKAGMGNGYGREIEIDHGNGIITVYGHLQGYNVVEGQSVVKGEVIGFVGHSGRTTGSHLHYEVRIRGSAVNPHKYLRTTMAQLGGSAIGGK